MKAVILAAGKGERMLPLTYHIPKPLLKIHNRPILDYIFEALPQEITEVIVVVKYLQEEVRKYLGSEFRGRKVYYREGSDRGTAFSFLAVRDLIEKDERFLFIYGDEFPDAGDIRKCLSHPLSIVVFQSTTPEMGGVVSLDHNNRIREIIEKPENPQSNIVADGVMVLNANIFNYNPFPHKHGEFYFASFLNQFVKDYPVQAVDAENFIGDITTPEDLKRIESLIKCNDPIE